MLPDANISRKRCERDATAGKFFHSLVDYRNNLFTSSTPDDIIKFYESFQTRDDLIGWMKERPKGAAYIHEVEGTKDIVVVIPTADFNGKYAKECRENIFKGLHIIFVESGEVPDPYFNYAHNCNIGIRKAMEYDPKWIVVSNDDNEKVDSVEDLREALEIGSRNAEGVLFSLPIRKFDDTYALVSKRTLRRNALVILSGKHERKRLALEKKFGIDYVIGSDFLPYRFFYIRRYRLRGIGNFAIFSTEILRSRQEILFDETYINGGEDIDLSWHLIQSGSRWGFLNYRIGNIGGATLGPYNIKRKMRGLLNDCYLNYKIEKREITMESIDSATNLA
jgi:hypothetical protein